MNLLIILTALVACVSANDIKGIKSPPANRNYFISPSRRAVAYPITQEKAVKQTPYTDDYSGKTQEPVKDYQPAQHLEPKKGYEPQRPIMQKPVEQHAKDQKPEVAHPVPQVPQDPQAPSGPQVPYAPHDSDLDDQSDGFDGPAQPAYDAPIDESQDESLVTQAPSAPVLNPVAQSPVPKEPVPQSPIRSPSAHKPYYRPQQPNYYHAPQEPQQVYQPEEPQQQVYQPQQPQQQQYDVPLSYGRRPATTLLRTPNGFYYSPGLAAYPVY